jgi:hypothetical protein
VNPAWDQYREDTTAWAVDTAHTHLAPLMLTDHGVLESRLRWLCNTFQIIRESIPLESDRDDIKGFRTGFVYLENIVLDVWPLSTDAHHRMRAASFGITRFRHDLAEQAGWTDADLELLDEPDAPGALKRLTWNLNALEPFPRGALIAANTALTTVCELAADPELDLDDLEFRVRGVLEALENATVTASAVLA